MPTYDYRCTSCNYTWEVFQSIKDKKITTCPKCQKETAERLISKGNGVIFKGSGFYETDYKRKKEPKKKKE